MGQLVKQAERREVGWAYLLWITPFLIPGVCGIHRFYTGRWVSGLLWLATGGLCGVGQFIDLFFINRMVTDYNDGRSVW